MNDKVTPPLKPRSDLGIRTLSGVAMMSVAIAAIWLGGYTFMGLVIAIGLGVFFEFTKLVLGFAQSRQAQILWPCMFHLAAVQRAILRHDAGNHAHRGRNRHGRRCLFCGTQPWRAENRATYKPIQNLVWPYRRNDWRGPHDGFYSSRHLRLQGR